MAAEPHFASPEELLAHAGWVRGLARSLVEDLHAADDLVQETWLAAMRTPPRGDRPLQPWLARVVHNLARQRGRGNRRRRRREEQSSTTERETSPSPPPDELLQELELQQQLTGYVAELDDPYRTVILERFYRGKTVARIASMRGTTAATIRSQIARGQAQLRERLERRFDGDVHAAFVALIGLAGEKGGAAAGAASALTSSTAAAWKGMGIMALASKTWPFAALGIVALLTVRHFALRGPQPAAMDTQLEVSLAPELAKGRHVPGSSPAEPDAESGVAEIDRDDRAALSTPPSELEEPEAAPAIEPMTTLSARILDGNGSALPGSTLTLVDHAGPEHEISSEPSRSDGLVELHLAEGAIWFPPTGSTQRSLRVEAPGHATHFLHATLIRDVHQDIGDVRLEPGGVVSGRVVDAHGRPVPSARIFATDAVLPDGEGVAARRGPTRSGRLNTARSRADDEGRFQLTGIGLGTARIWAHAPGMRYAFSEPLEVALGATHADLRLVLEELEDADRIAGRVFGPDGEPAPNVQVSSYFPATFFSYEQATSDAEGRFEFVVRERKAHFLSAIAADGEHAPSVQVRAEPGDLDLRLELREHRWVRVEVRDAEGEPIEDAELRFDADDDFHLTPTWTHNEGGGDYTWSDTGLAGVLSVHAEGFERRTERIEAASRVDRLRFTLARTRGLRGVVQDADGQRVAGAHVHLQKAMFTGGSIVHRGFAMRMDPSPEASVETDEEGRFEIPHHEEGSFHVVVEAPAVASSELGPFAFDPEQGLELEPIVLTSGGALEGLVVLADGSRPTSHLVIASRGDGWLRMERTDSNGLYRFEHLAPGPWQIEAVDREPQFSSFFSSEPHEFDGDVTVLEGLAVRHDLDQRGVEPIAFTGRLALDGHPAAGWTVTIADRSRGPNAVEVQPVVLDAQGRFAFQLPPGEWKLTLVSPARDAKPASLSDEFDIELDPVHWEQDLPTGGLTGHLPEPEDPTEAVQSNLFSWKGAGALAFRVEVAPDANGTFHIDGLPEGKGTLYQLLRNELGDIRWVKVAEPTVEADQVTRL